MAAGPLPNVVVRAAPAELVRPSVEEIPRDGLGPSFDIVRIGVRGNAVFAGRAVPGAEVTVNAGDTIVGIARANDVGAWVLVPESPLPAGPQDLTSRAVTPNGMIQQSRQVVTVVVPGQDAAPRARPVAILQDRDGEAPPRVLAGAVPDPGAREGELTLDAVRYDEGGNVVLSGRARADTLVRAFVDDVDVGIGTPGGEEGVWEIVPARTLDVGRHDLRLEQTDRRGTVLAQVELPFIRAELVGGLAPGVVIVQPGNSLWRIARSIYGKGVLYTIVFLANADQIEDPNLIYPGQLFALPAPPED